MGGRGRANGPDMRYEILRSMEWVLAPDAPAHLLNEIADLRCGTGLVPLVLRFPGFDPRTHLSRAGPAPSDPADRPITLAEHSHVDAILLLTGGPASGIDDDPLFGEDAGTNLRAVMEADHHGVDKADIDAMMAMHAEAEAARKEDGLLLDLVVVRQMRAVPLRLHGRASNEMTVREERCARLYRTYDPDLRPSRQHRIGRLVGDAATFARVQAYNLGFETNPRPEIAKVADRD